MELFIEMLNSSLTGCLMEWWSGSRGESFVIREAIDSLILLSFQLVPYCPSQDPFLLLHIM